MVYIKPKMLQFLCLSFREYYLVCQFVFYELLGNITSHVMI